VPELIEEDFAAITGRALARQGKGIEDVSHWCLHPGGKRILQAVHKCLGFTNGQLQCSYDTLQEVGNISSATILFVLKRLMSQKNIPKLFGAAFGPGLTVETFTAHS
jgi:predicted naringenin-chalcone synthase